jgi:glycosyltransferase involved in cell wall biosynthesis
VAVKVAFQIDQLGFRAPGGIGTYVSRLLEALPAADPSIDLVPFHAPFVEGPAEVPLTSTGGWGVELRTPVRYLYPAWDLLGWPPLPTALRGCGVVHITNPAGVAPVRGPQALVVTVHDLAFEHFPAALPRRWLRLYRAGLRAAVRRADAILTPSRSTADDVVDRTGIDPAKVHVTPLAAAPAEGRAPSDHQLETHGVRSPYILFVGTIEKRKNLLRLLRAYHRIAEDLPHALVLNGPPGWGADEVVREVRSGGRAGRIVLTSGLDGGTLDALYAHADAFVYPSLYEGFGLPVLEALRHGLPVVASNSSSIPEVAGEAALLVDPTDLDALTDALRRALTDRGLRADLARRGPVQAARFSWEATARATLAAYRSAEASTR